MVDLSGHFDAGGADRLAADDELGRYCRPPLLNHDALVLGSHDKSEKLSALDPSTS